MIAIYSRSPLRGPLPLGARVLNPSFFIAPEPGVTAVYLNGEDPKIQAAYEAAGVPVQPLAEFPAPSAEHGPPRRRRSSAKRRQ